MIYYNDNQNIIRELARKYGTSYDVIKEAVESPFAFIYEEMKKYDEPIGLPDFHIPRLGKFMVRFKYRNDN